MMGRVPESQRPLARAILALTKAEALGDSWIHRTSVSVSVSVDLECDVGRPRWKRWAKTAPPRGTQKKDDMGIWRSAGWEWLICIF